MIPMLTLNQTPIGRANIRDAEKEWKRTMKFLDQIEKKFIDENIEQNHDGYTINYKYYVEWFKRAAEWFNRRNKWCVANSYYFSQMYQPVKESYGKDLNDCC